MTQPKLPDLPSDLILVALADLRKCEAMPEVYRVYMGTWHEREGGKCMVCLAGSVIAQTFGASPAVDSEPSDFEHKDKLIALNYFRDSYYERAFETLDLHAPDASGWPEITPYDVNPEQFRADMQALALRLKGCEL